MSELICPTQAELDALLDKHKGVHKPLLLKDLDISDLTIDGIDLKGLQIHNCRAEKLAIRNSHLAYCEISGSNLEGCKINRSVLANSTIKNSHLDRSTFNYVDLTNARLGEVSLELSEFYEADLWKSKLHNVDLGTVDLFNVIGDGTYIKSIQLFPEYKINYTSNHLQIGCEKYTFEEWWTFTDWDIGSMDDGNKSLNFWEANKEHIRHIVEKFPASPIPLDWE